MKVELHPNAVAAFNEQANIVSESVAFVAPSQRSPQGPRPDVHISAHITSADVRGPIRQAMVDRYHNVVTRFESEGGSTIGLDQGAYAKLRKLALLIQKTDAFRDIASLQFIEDALFSWSLQKIKGKTSKTACEHIIAEAEAKVGRHEIWVPVYGLNIQSEFNLGRVKFKTITREMIDEWHRRKSAEASENPQFNFKFDRDKRNLLGFAAATIEIDAEPIRAAEVAQDLSDKAIALLRLFSAANFDPLQFSYCVPFGSHQRNEHRYLRVKDGKIVTDTQGITSQGEFPWRIDNASLREFEKAGLNVLGALFDKEPKNEFEQIVFNALILYSDAALVPTLAEKLLYMFAALESILLRDENEPITENISERLAYIAAGDSESRIAVKKSVKRAYGVRSRFVHHGKRQDDDLSAFFMHAWGGLMAIAERSSRYQTKQELLDELERYKYRS